MLRTVFTVASHHHPNSSDQVSPWLTVVLPVAIAAVGLLGVFGAAFIAARSAVVVRLIDSNRAIAEEHRAFQRLVVNAVNELALAQGQWMLAIKAAIELAIASVKPGQTKIDLSVPDGGHTSRIESATVKWREAMAEAHLYADEETVHAMEAYDARRAVVVEALNKHQIETAERENNLLLEYDARQIYRLLQITKVKTELAFIGPMRAIRFRKALRNVHEDLVKQHNRAVEFYNDAEADYERTEGERASS